jgi:hypothetical protein
VLLKHEFKSSFAEFSITTIFLNLVGCVQVEFVGESSVNEDDTYRWPLTEDFRVKLTCRVHATSSPEYRETPGLLLTNSLLFAPSRAESSRIVFTAYGHFDVVRMMSSTNDEDPFLQVQQHVFTFLALSCYY